MGISSARATRATAVETVLQDVRHALRMLRRSPGTTATIVLTLALGIGANAAIFAVVNALLLRPLPIADPDRLVTISSDAALARGYPSGFGWSFAMWQALQPHISQFGGALAWTPATFDLAGGGERQQVDGIFASGGYFGTLGVSALRGRTLTAVDDRPGGGPDGPVAVISHRLWHRHFGGADSVVGAALAVDGVKVTIVGVMAPEFSGVDVGRPVDVVLPIEPLIHRMRSTLRRSLLLVMLRLGPGQSAEAGTAIIRGLQPEILGVTRENMSSVRPAHNQEPFTLVPAATGTSLPVRGPTGLRQDYGRALLTILGVALVVLLIACVNIANLLLARAAARAHEIGLRLALGAPRGRIARQLLLESLALAALAAIGGLAVGQWISQALVSQLSTPTERIIFDLSLDWRVLTFAATVGLATAAAFGVVPAFRAMQIAPIAVLKSHARTLRSHEAGSGRLVSLSSGLVVVQIALSLMLAVAAGLLVGSFAELSSVPLGFDPDRVLVVNVDMEHARRERVDRMHLSQQIVDAVASVPGVAHAGGSIWTPVDGGLRMGDSEHRVAFNFVTPGWFASYGTAIRAGRDFTRQDTAEAPPVAIVNEAFVRALVPDGSPLGKAIPYPRSRTNPLERTIVGVVDDAVSESQREGIPKMVYLPIAQALGNSTGGPRDISVGVRPTAGPPLQLARSVGAAIQRLDPALSFSFHLQSAHVQASVRQERLVAMLSGLFGALALVMAALGLYGTTSYMVRRRVAEIGIRRALGAQRLDVLKLVLGHTLALSTVGIALGLGSAAVGTRVFRAMLFGLTPLDPVTFGGVAVLFAVVATLAALRPAWRATSVDPLVALRHE
jgi:putative ABC transport system permease protein